MYKESGLGAMTNQNISPLIPFSWFENHLTEDLLPLWYKASVTENGLFHSPLDQQWKRMGKKRGTLVSQSRLLFVFSVGFLKTGNPNYKRVVQQGADFLLNHFYDKVNGGFNWTCDQNGKIIKDFKDAYGHTFLILGFTYAYKVTGEEKYLKTAIEVFFLIEEKFQDEFGGLVWKKTNDWIDSDKHRSQNPLMHYFEAILVLFETLNDETIPEKFIKLLTPKTFKQRAEKIVNFLFPRQKLTPEFFLWEFYSLDWQPIDLDQNGPLSSGHHFEWAFLLSYGVEVSLLKNDKLPLAKHCLNAALKLGYEESGIVRAYMNKSGNLTDTSLYWWDFSEALRTLIHFIIQHKQLDLIPIYQKIISFVKGHLIDPEFGGWYFSLDSNGKPLITIKGHLGKLDYHQTGLCLEVGRLEKIINAKSAKDSQGMQK